MTTIMSRTCDFDNISDR